ncbi:Oxoglutarate and iron-dependent oxygenase degradation C-term-domain-containing protein [Hyaloraphidium curvatum]|nr:Oxoglutarate and iron-dependent oxygenase degradation C-term-domain-containing protein [Hyaloraphidium curvatum]
MSTPTSKRPASGSPSASAKKQKQKAADIPPVEIRALYSADSPVVAALGEAFRGHKDHKDEESGAFVVGAPFPVCVLDGPFDDGFLRTVKEELEDQEWVPKSNDLYEFVQTKMDLGRADTPAISALRTALYSPEFRALVGAVTGLEFNDTTDLSSHRYPPNGYLACHDDDIADDAGNGRRVAFILYLVPEGWDHEHGGRLELFDTDGDGQPKEVGARIIPRFGRFAFFETTPTSYHQVSENLANMDRWSISGWLHGPRPKVTPPKQPSAIQNPELSLHDRPAGELADWINKEYLTEKLAEEISDQFVKASEADLRRCLVPEKYAAVAKQLEEASWEDVGPANRRRYAILRDPMADKETPLAKLLDFATSAKFAGYLNRLTNLDLESVRVEVRQLEAGSYTLLSDSDAGERPTLDVLLTFFEKPDGTWPEEWGGEHHYVAGEDDLLVVFPYDNALSMVYREAGVMRFVKMVNHQCEFARREIVLTFAEKEREPGESGSEEEGDEDAGEESPSDEDIDEGDALEMEDEDEDDV